MLKCYIEVLSFGQIRYCQDGLIRQLCFCYKASSANVSTFSHVLAAIKLTKLNYIIPTSNVNICIKGTVQIYESLIDEFCNTSSIITIALDCFLFSMKYPQYIYCIIPSKNWGHKTYYT